MKKHIVIGGIFLSLISYGQESVFKTINQKGIGILDATAQSFLIHRSGQSNTSFNNTASSLAFVLNYESPTYKNLSLNISYIQAVRYQKQGKTAELLQNNSFSSINNISLNYHLNKLGFKDGTISVGRFPLNTEFMTTYQIRQKQQAYEGVLLDLGKVKNWNFKLGYITKFSSWKSNLSDFNSISRTYVNRDDITSTQEFAEASYNSKEGHTRLTLYYNVANDILKIGGLSYQQRILSVNNILNINFKGKGITQWSAKSSNNTAVHGIQSGLLASYEDFNIEGGLFLVRGKKTIENTFLQNPFGAKLILSEPLIGTDNSFDKGSESYYIESSYRFPTGKIYALLLHTHTENIVSNEFNVIASYNINKKWSPSLKLGFLKENSTDTNSDVLDIRLVLSYAF